MVTRLAIVGLILLAAGSARAEVLSPEAARRFVAGKLFAFNCFDGSRGAGRIYGDGSVIGTIQFRGAGPVRTVALPAGTLRDRGGEVCASLRGMPFEPCFHLWAARVNSNASPMMRCVSGSNCSPSRYDEIGMAPLRSHS